MKLLLMLFRALQVKTMGDDPEDKKLLETPPPLEPPEPQGVAGFIDELVFLIFLIPMIGVFLPQFRDDIKAGFDILSNMPDWFSFVIVLGVLSIFGFRKQLVDILNNFANFRKK